MAIAYEESHLRAADGLQLFLALWRPERPRGSMVLVHGLAEHSGRYRHVAERFAGTGLAVYAPEYRGHGRSPGLPGHVDRFDDFVADVDAARARTRTEHPELPLFLTGHSQGGLIALRSALLAPDAVDGLILSSPLLGAHPQVRPGPWLSAAARALSVLAPRLRLANHVDPFLLSRDPTVGAAYAADPLVGRRVSARWYTELLAAIADSHARAPTLAVPALVMVSSEDRVVDPGATARWVASAPAGRVELVRWEGLFHEMFNEPERERVFARMEAWIGGRLAARGAAPPAR